MNCLESKQYSKTSYIFVFDLHGVYLIFPVCTIPGFVFFFKRQSQYVALVGLKLTMLGWPQTHKDPLVSAC